MNEINESFIKSIDNKVSECSSIVQLYECFQRFKHYAYNEYVYNSFYNKIDYFEGRSVDTFISEQCDKLKEDLELELQIGAVSSNVFMPEVISNKQEIEVNLSFTGQEGKIFMACIDNLLKMTLEKTKGKKQEAARLLGLDYSDFKKLISDNKNIKNYVLNLKRKLKRTKPGC